MTAEAAFSAWSVDRLVHQVRVCFWEWNSASTDCFGSLIPERSLRSVFCASSFCTTRTIIDGRTLGFCKMFADRKTCKVIGCHVIGERAVDVAEVAAIAIAAGMRVDDLAQLPLAYPIYVRILARAAVMAAGQLGSSIGWQAHRFENVSPATRQSGEVGERR
ncbi:hypothetical protein [Bradyrhizobium sp. BR 1433]|uniref:hypothetical protein n=1 Tax=Bradyrhizobium sp. BR 1433 TaxID=3447967 RepID=UPI003EE7BA8A